MGQQEHKRLIAASAVLCVALLIAAGAFLTLRLNGSRTSFEPFSLTDDTSDMVLIDIADQEAASYYHVMELGVYVLAADEGGKAYAMGVRSGDRIVSANGVLISSSDELSELESQLAYDEELVLVVSRGPEGETLTITMDASANLSL